MTTRFEAFLSYTRPDDRFFGGNITAMCQVLELGVQVVTGNRDFTIFQDVDGIGLGEDWRDKLADAIAGSVFFVPVITALYFTSPACRDELERFQQHEASLGRKDLILPIYFVTAPVLERPELLDTDPLATGTGSVPARAIASAICPASCSSTPRFSGSVGMPFAWPR